MDIVTAIGEFDYLYFETLARSEGGGGLVVGGAPKVVNARGCSLDLLGT